MGKKVFTENSEDIYGLVGLSINQAIAKLDGLFPDSNNYYSTACACSGQYYCSYRSSRLFRFGNNPIHVLQVFTEYVFITDCICIV